MPHDFFKLLEQALKPKPQYLSFKPKNGRPNVRSLVYQAINAGINDPRPYVQTVLTEEQKRVAIAIKNYDFDAIAYGFNIKLATFVTFFKEIQLKVEETVPLKVAVTFYEFEKELEKYNKLILANAANCPYIWLYEEINKPEYHRPGTHSIFKSKKLKIYMKDGYIHYSEPAMTYKVPLVYNTIAQKFYF